MGVEYVLHTTITWKCDYCGMVITEEVSDSLKPPQYPKGWMSALVFIKKPHYHPRASRDGLGSADGKVFPSLWRVDGVPEDDAKFCMACDKCSKNLMPA